MSRRQRPQRVANLAGTARYARDLGDLAVACHRARRYRRNGLTNSRGASFPVDGRIQHGLPIRRRQAAVLVIRPTGKAANGGWLPRHNRARKKLDGLGQMLNESTAHSSSLISDQFASHRTHRPASAAAAQPSLTLRRASISRFASLSTVSRSRLSRMCLMTRFGPELPQDLPPARYSAATRPTTSVL